MKTITIHQPSYLPWLGYFHKIAAVDTFIILDHVQFEKGGFTNRNKILPPDGRPFWLTVPVLTKKKSKQAIDEIEINNVKNWQEKHFRSISEAYSKTPYWKDYETVIREYYRYTCQNLALYLETFLFYLVINILKLEIKCRLSSFYTPSLEKAGSDLILEICQREKTDVYFSGPSGRTYLDEQEFIKNGIKVIYQDFQHPEYLQHQLKNNHDFIPGMCILDLLFNCGPESLKIIEGTCGHS